MHPWMENSLDFSPELSSFNTASKARPFMFPAEMRTSACLGHGWQPVLRVTGRAQTTRLGSHTLHGLQANQPDKQDAEALPVARVHDKAYALLAGFL